MPDIFDFFKDNESKLHERPPEQVWEKLEQKLERGPRPKRRNIRFVEPYTVALILFLLLFAAAMVWYFVHHFK